MIGDVELIFFKSTYIAIIKIYYTFSQTIKYKIKSCLSNNVSG